MAYISRRGVLAGASALGFAGGTGMLAALAPTAAAADTSGYKALVCVFLKGGLDGADTVLPLDAASHDALRKARGDLFGAYGVGSGSSSRDRERLRELDSARDFGGRRFGLPPEMEPLHDLYASKRMAVVGNVGPLIEPTTRTRMDSGASPLPERLFSHNDQQAVWMSGDLEGKRAGWGGAFADSVAPGGGPALTFTSITATTPDSFLNAARTRQYPGRRDGPVKLSVVADGYRLGDANDAARRILSDHYASLNARSDNLLRRDLIAANRRTQSDNALFGDAIQGARAFTTPFPDTELGQQLLTIASCISIRGALGASRQLFYASIIGFDTHSRQTTDLPDKLGEVAGAIAAFDAAMGELGLGEQVTLFTASDFGRTTVANGGGTDHGWGGHQFVVGGGVRGGEIHGDIPPVDFTDEQYTASRGRLIPTTSVDQYAASLGRWFGLGEGELRDALPNLQNFDTRLDLFG